MARAIRILGIDPGLRRTGWGVIEAKGNRLIYVACGSAETDDDAPLADWVDYIYLRDNPRGPHREYWHHVHGCRAYVTVERDTATHAIVASTGAAS